MRILEAYQERVGDISDEDVRAEGYKDAEEYFNVLAEINGLDVFDDNVLDMQAWVVRFKVEEVSNDR